MNKKTFIETKTNDNKKTNIKRRYQSIQKINNKRINSEIILTNQNKKRVRKRERKNQQIEEE